MSAFNKSVLPALCAMTVLGVSSAFAQATAQAPAVSESPVVAPASPMSAATAAEIQRINENMTLLQAQLNQLELKTKIALKQRELSAGGGTDAFSSFGSKKGVPAVVEIGGRKGHLEAVLVFPGGVTQRVVVGDVIEERRVSKIEMNEVVLTDLKGKGAQRLAFGSAATMRDSAQPPVPTSMGIPTVR